MSTTELSRAGTAAAARSPRRALVALGVVAALTGGGLVAQAGQASAAPVSTASHSAKPMPSTSLKVTQRSVSKGASKSHRPQLTMKATRSGKAIAGKAKLIINGKTISTRKLKSGKITFAPYWSTYKVGKNKVRIVIDPANNKLANRSSRTVTVTAKKAGSPVVKVATTYIGARYVYGGSSPKGFDCSGFTSYVYKKAIGKSLPRSSSAQKSVGKTVSRSNAKAGDIVWTPGHVAIYAGNGKVIEAGNPRVGVVKRKMWQDNPRFIRVSSKAV